MKRHVSGTQAMFGTTIETRSTSLTTQMLLLFTLLTVIPSVNAFTITITAPESTSLFTNFSVTVTTLPQTTDKYDIKLFVQEGKKENLSELFTIDKGWKSTFLYLKEAYPAKTEYLMRVVQSASNASLCVRLRKTGAKTYTEYCQLLSIAPTEEDSLSTHQTSNQQPSPKEKQKRKSISQSLTANIVQQLPEKKLPSAEPSFIKLQAHSSQPTLPKTTLLTLALFSLLAFVILILIFFRKI